MRVIFVAFFVLLCTTAYADGLIVENTSGFCTVDDLYVMDNVAIMHAVFQPNTYNCGAGYFLPANGIECAPCPVEHSCPGGTYTFNENYDEYESITVENFYNNNETIKFTIYSVSLI